MLAKYALAVVFMMCIAGCSNPKQVDDSSKTAPAIQQPESSNEPLIESTTLKREMIDAVVEMVQFQKPGTDPKVLREDVIKTLDQSIKLTREHAPEFLMVSEETESELQAGSAIQDSAERIAAAEKVFAEFQVRTGAIVNMLLPQHKSGTLSPVRTELLAHLMVSDAKRIADSLTK